MALPGRDNSASESIPAQLLHPLLMTKKQPLERHHLFLRAWLEEPGATDLKTINQAANLALWEWPDNLQIGKTPLPGNICQRSDPAFLRKNGGESAASMHCRKTGSIFPVTNVFGEDGP